MPSDRRPPADPARVDVVAAVRAAAATTPSPRSWGWWLLAGVGCFVALVLSVLVWAALQPPKSQHLIALPVATPTAIASSPAADWRSVVAALDDARAAAFANADAAALSNFDAPGSPAARFDDASVAVLAARRVRADGFVLDVASVQPLRVTAARVSLRVTDSRRSFQWRNLNGALVAAEPARPRTTWLVQLVRGGAVGWRVESVTLPGQQRASPQSSGR